MSENVDKAVSAGELPKNWRRAHPRWVQVTVLLVVFGAGGCVGAMFATYRVHSQIQHFRQNADALPDAITPRLKRILGLTTDQTTQVREIIGRRHPRIVAFRKQGMEGMHTEFDAMEKEISDVLDEGQASKWHDVADSVRYRFLP